MKGRRKTGTRIGILLLSVLLLFGMVGTVNAANKTVTIGVIAQLTGPYGPPTRGIMEGALDVIEAVNKYDPIPGITLKGVFVDGASSPAKAMSACKKILLYQKRNPLCNRGTCKSFMGNAFMVFFRHSTLCESGRRMGRLLCKKYLA